MALLPLTIAGTAFKGGVGLFQALRGLFTKDPERPEMTIPQATRQMVSRAEIRANQTTDPILQSELSDIERSAGGAVGNLRRGVSSTSELLTGLGAIESSKAIARNRAFGGFGSRQYSYENNLLRAYDTLRQDQIARWNWNKRGRYLEEKARRENMIAAGLQNIGTAASEAGVLGVYSDMFGGNQNGGANIAPQAPSPASGLRPPPFSFDALSFLPRTQQPRRIPF